jgi:hypothetical protein
MSAQGDNAVWVNGRRLVVPDGSALVGSGPRVVVRLACSPTETVKARLAALGSIEFWCPPSGACLTLKGKRAAIALAGEAAVSGFVPYDQADCQRGLVTPESGPGLRWLDVVCFSSGQRSAVTRGLRRLGAQVLGHSSSKVRIDWPGDPSPIRDLVGVKLVERPHVPHLTTIGLASDVGFCDDAGAWLQGLDGLGEIVAVADTGLDTGNRATLVPDLAGRVVSLDSWPIDASWSPFVTNPGADDGAADTSSGHGTYVAGVVLGNGALSNGANRGVAPRARLVFQAIEQWVAVAPGHPEVGPSAFGLAGRPMDIRDLFLQARVQGARLHVIAWGTAARGAYDNDAFETDLFLYEHSDALVLCASGNSGSDADGNRRIDPGTIMSPATAKNVLTVGATEGSAMIGFPGTWAQLQNEGRVFGNSADRADAVYGQPDRMAMLSSAGPTSDGRIKPDICAPGTDVVGPRSSQANGRGWGLVSPSPHYMADGGTSVAVAVAGGGLALLRQAWRKGRGGHAPVGSTMKALAVLGAVPVMSRDGLQPEGRNVCGFGRLDVGASLPKTRGGHVTLILCNGTRARAVQTSQVRRFRVRLPQGGRLRAALCWYDAPGERLVNDLDLTLNGPSLTSPVWGNHQPASPGQPDRVNTVEVIDVDALPAGVWELVVTGVNVPAGPQRFSLVAQARAISQHT